MSKKIGRGNIMRNSLKFLATAMVAAMLACFVSMASFAASTPFKDIDDKDETLSEAVALLSNLGVAKGTSETTFGTMDSVTREQMSAFVYRLMKNGKSLENVPNSSPFKDLQDSTYFGYVSWANASGIIKGTSATTFDPKGGITLQDAYTMIVRALGHEDDTYVYPFSYIDKAEELGLDEGLDSAVNYDTKLRRGDIAILLYNAFFAETGHKETKQVERLIGNGSKWVLETKTEYSTLAEYVYGVEVGEFEVRATPKYAFNESEDSSEYVPLCDEFDKDMLHLVAVEDDEELDEFYCDFEETGLDGKADDYIMNSVKVYYTVDEDGNTKKLDKVYSVSYQTKVLETNNVSGYYVDTNDANDYFTGTDYAKVEGYVTSGSETIYFFDAPYTYAKPDYNSIKGNYSSDELEEIRYQLRNEKNVKLINVKCLDMAKGTYSYYVDTDAPTDTPEELITNLQRVYSRGVYKMKFYDIDGDGIYNYVHYMPATYGFMNGDDGKYFSTAMTENAPVHKSVSGSDIDISFVPTIYYNDADISGTTFKDGDFVLAYLNPEANMIEVMSVIQPYRGYISLVRTDHGQVKIDSTTFSTAYVYRAVEEFDDDSSSNYSTYHSDNYLYKKHYYSQAKTFPNLISQNSVGEVFDVYAYKVFGQNCILYYDHIEDATISFGLDELVIPVSDEDYPSETFTQNKFDASIGDTVYYARVYLDGKVKYIPLNVEDMYPALDEGYSNGNYNLYDVIGQDGLKAYLDKICKFSVDSDGLYTLVPLLHAEDEDGEYVGISRDSTTLVEDDNSKQYGNDLGYTVEGIIKKIAGTKYELVSATSGQTLLGDVLGANGESGKTIKYFTLTPSSRIIIKNTITNDDNDVEFLEYDYTTFGGTTSARSTLTNIQYVLKGDPDSANRADLVLLYAEATDFEFDTKSVKDSWRIVKDSTIVKDDNGYYRHSYTLLNPYTGEVLESVLGDNYESKVTNLDDEVEVGTIIEVKNGLVDEDGKVLGKIDTSDNAGLVWITDYDESENSIGVVPVETIDNAIDDGDICCREALVDYVENYKYYGTEKNFDGEEYDTTVDSSDAPVYGTGLYFEVTDDTVITVLKYSKAGDDTIVKGEFTLADLKAISDPTKDYKCYNEKVENRNGNYSTAYAEYVKAYVYTSEADDEDELPEAKYIIIVVNGDEDMIFSDTDANFLPKSCD